MGLDNSDNPLSGGIAQGLARSQDLALQAKQKGKLKQACQMFESQFLKMMWKEMRRTVPKGGLVSGGYGEQMFTDMLDQSRADLSVKGRSMGLADMLEKQLSKERLKRIPGQLRQRTGGSLAQGSYAPATALEAALAPAGDSVTLPMPMPIPDDKAAAATQDPAVQDQAATAAQDPAAQNQAAAAVQDQAVQDQAAPLQTDRQAPSVAPVSLPANPYPKSLGNSSELTVPVAGGEVSGTFGLRVHPVTGEVRPHRGLDLAAPEGTPIRAALGGVVRYASEAGDFGRLVVVEHDDGSSAYYGHCSSVKVRPGQRVTQGQVLGAVGQTGLATGPHLHFEMHDSTGEAVDPLPMVAKGLGPNT